MDVIAAMQNTDPANLPPLEVDPAVFSEKTPWNTWAPEKRVMARVIAQAIDDALAPRDCAVWEIQGAHDFFYDGRLETFCFFIDWRPSDVRAYYERSRERVRNGEKWKRLSTIDSVQTPLVREDFDEDEEDEDDDGVPEGLPDYMRSDYAPRGVDCPGGAPEAVCEAEEIALTA